MLPCLLLGALIPVERNLEGERLPDTSLILEHDPSCGPLGGVVIEARLLEADELVELGADEKVHAVGQGSVGAIEEGVHLPAVGVDIQEK